ncbi:MAG: V-type ATPase subunit subunit G family protein [Candidatus Omnitrophota bacterium]|nr:V-type ATPase subunit subunit G family protein [Candidatus Omnitrophota bacterium]
MKEIIEEILKEEQQSRKRVEKARQEAENIIVGARNEAQDVLDKTTASFKELVRERKVEAENKFLQDKENILKKTREESTALRKDREKDIPSIARAVFLRVIDIKD